MCPCAHASSPRVSISTNPPTPDSMPATTPSAGPDPVFRMAITEPTAIDPYRAQEVEGIGVTKQLFVGLTQIDERQRPAPAVARSWESDPAGTVWTFHLRRDVVF